MTFTEAVTDVRARTDQDIPSGGSAANQPVTDTQIGAWINAEYRSIRRVLGEIAPTLYSKVATFTISSGNTQDVTASPMSLVDFEHVRRLERLAGTTYCPLEVANRLDPEDTDDYAFLERGTVLEIYPSTSAIGSYKLTYIAMPVAISGSTALDVPPGVEQVILERVAAKIRRRFEEDPNPHLVAAEAAFKEARAYLQNRYGAHPSGMIDG